MKMKVLKSQVHLHSATEIIALTRLNSGNPYREHSISKQRSYLLRMLILKGIVDDCGDHYMVPVPNGTSNW